jgi:hypothetical protein
MCIPRSSLGSIETADVGGSSAWAYWRTSPLLELDGRVVRANNLAGDGFFSRGFGTVTGVLMSGLSVSALFAIVNRMVAERALALLPRPEGHHMLTINWWVQ